MKKKNGLPPVQEAIQFWSLANRINHIRNCKPSTEGCKPRMLLLFVYCHEILAVLPKSPLKDPVRLQ